MMRTVFEEMLADSLRDRAEADYPVDPAPLLHDAREQGQRIRARRRLVTAVVAAGSVTAVVLTGAALGRPSTARPATVRPTTSHPPAGPVADVLPRAIGTPGAATDPGLVGSDPWVLHLSVDALAGRQLDGTWRSTRTYELASGIWNGATVTVAIARDPDALPTLGNGLEKVSVSAPAAVTVAGRPGTMVKATPRWAPKADYTLDWQPVPGLWARVEAERSTPDQALRAAAAVRFDQATRCAQPFAVGALPAGLRVQYCQVFLVSLRTGVTYGDGEIDFGGAGRGLQLKAMRLIAGARPPGVTKNVGGLTFALASIGPDKYTRQELTRVLDSIHLVGSPGDPSTYR
jgi:hypothetical protein